MVIFVSRCSDWVNGESAAKSDFSSIEGWVCLRWIKLDYRLDGEPMDRVDHRARKGSGIFAMMAEIERSIASGAWAPGTKLPTERELEAQFGLARNTLRKSLKRLEEEGKIVRHVGRGSFVAPIHATVIGRDDANLAQRLSGASPAEVMEVRLIVEPEAAELAATRANADDFRRIGECLLECERANAVMAFEHWDGMLHLAIIAAAKNSLLEALCGAINEVRNQPEWAKLKQRSVTPERRQLYQQQHDAIVTALRDRDGVGVKRALRHHLRTVQANLLQP
jgi:GntR family transcriptional repressor for pyruvate dehydrogenase complex